MWQKTKNSFVQQFRLLAVFRSVNGELNSTSPSLVSANALLHMSGIASTSAYTHKVIAAALRSLTMYDESLKVRIDIAGSGLRHATDRSSINPCLYFVMFVDEAVLDFTWQDSRQCLRWELTKHDRMKWKKAQMLQIFCLYQIFAKRLIHDKN